MCVYRLSYCLVATRIIDYKNRQNNAAGENLKHNLVGGLTECMCECTHTFKISFIDILQFISLLAKSLNYANVHTEFCIL